MPRILIVLLTLAILTAPALADLTIENNSKVSAFVALTAKPVSEEDMNALKKFDYATFRKAHPGYKNEKVGPGQMSTLQAMPKGHGVVYTYVTGAVKAQQFLPFEYGKTPTKLVITDDAKDFHIRVKTTP